MKTRAAIGLMIVVMLAGCAQFIPPPAPTVRSMVALNAPGQYGVEFQAYFYDGELPISIAWDVGDGIVRGNEAVYQFNTWGEYLVTMVATDALGRTAAADIRVLIDDYETVCYFDGPDLVCTFEGWGMVLPEEAR